MCIYTLPISDVFVCASDMINACQVYKDEGPPPQLSSAQSGPNLQNRARSLLTSAAPVAPKNSSKSPPKHHAEADDGTHVMYAFQGLVPSQARAHLKTA